MAQSNRYPGHQLDLRYVPDHRVAQYPIGAHQSCPGASSDVLQVREVFMMLLMDRLTDKPGWEKKVFDDEITAKWRKEAEEMDQGPWYREVTEGKDMDRIHQPGFPIINSGVFDYCLEELKRKAKYFEKTCLIPTLDSAGNSIVKSDTLLSDALKSELRASFDKLRADQASNVDWHPRSNDQVQDLVHPSMYPFVYGRSPFIEQEVVGVSDAVQKWSGKSGVVIPKAAEKKASTRWRWARSVDELPRELWSTNYQWLPANLAFQSDGSVKSTSYINNLHPDKYPSIYRAIERLIDTAIPAWEQCLRKQRDYVDVAPVGIVKPRFDRPGYVADDMDELWEEFDEAKYNALHKLDRYQLSDSEKEDMEYDIQQELDEGDLDTASLTPEAKLQAAREKVTKEHIWRNMRDPDFPMPDKAPDDISYKPHHTLRDSFKSSGLQVIVKMATIELTPEKPEFPQGGWHIEGQMNERICATALYYLDSENVTPSHLSFRISTAPDANQDFDYGQDSYNYLEQIYGTDFTDSGACLQNYGSVETREGRLLAFPNTFQHRVSSFKLQDPTKPGHRRFIALWLVDPHVRIISTANVPPQQLNWWVEATFGAGEKPKRGTVPPEVFQMLQESGVADVYPDDKSTNANRLPAEVMDMVRKEGVVPPSLMTVEEAREHRLALMAERSRFHEDSEQMFQSNSYSFCEH